MSFSCTVGVKGRLKASGIEFKIVAVTRDTSTIELHIAGLPQVEVRDEELRASAEQIDDFTK